MPPDTSQTGEALQGTARPDGTNRFDLSDWRHWLARSLWTLRAARVAWTTWTPGTIRGTWVPGTARPDGSGGTDRPDRAVGQRKPGGDDRDDDDHLHPPP